MWEGRVRNERWSGIGRTTGHPEGTAMWQNQRSYQSQLAEKSPEKRSILVLYFSELYALGAALVGKPLSPRTAQ